MKQFPTTNIQASCKNLEICSSVRQEVDFIGYLYFTDNELKT